MDTLNTLLLGWLFSAALILVLVKFLYDKFLRGGPEDEESEVISCASDTATYSAAEETVRPSRPTIFPASQDGGSASPAAGQDADAVRWVNTVMTWLYRGPNTAVSQPYILLLNEMTAQTALETGVLIEVAELLASTPAPSLHNIVVDCAPNDHMTLTCDVCAELHVRIQTTRTHRNVTTESEYAARVQPIAGRLTAAILPHCLTVTVTFLGWPQVEMELEGIRNNQSGLAEKELQEVIREVVTLAIRNMNLQLDLAGVKGFPGFQRARDLPERVMPVGYDSMVREKMTHPPKLKPKLPPAASGGATSSVTDACAEDVRSSRPPAACGDSRQSAAGNSHHFPAESYTLAPTLQHPLGENYGPQCPRGSDYSPQCPQEPDYSPQGPPWSDSFTPAHFLEQVRAVARAVVEEKTLAAPQRDQTYVLHATSAAECPSPCASDREHARLTGLLDGPLAGMEDTLTGHDSVTLPTVQENGRMYSEDDDNEDGMYTYQDDIYTTADPATSLDYLIPYDSEYEEEEDLDDYLEHRRKPAQGKQTQVASTNIGAETTPSTRHKIPTYSIPSNIRNDDVFIPNQSDTMIHKNSVSMSSNTGIDGVIFSTSSTINNKQGVVDYLTKSSLTPLGAMGLPHHPKSNFTPSPHAPAPAPHGAALNGKRLLVKIVKAAGVAADKVTGAVYCVVEMDEPTQKFTTATVTGTNSPFWDEQFLFDLSDITLELLFELYDASSSSFLGLGIVGIEELMATPSQRQIIPLQARPYEDDSVTGTLTVEFLFLDGGDLPELTVRCSNVQQSSSPRGTQRTITTTTYATAPLATDVTMRGRDSVTATALRDITSPVLAGTGPTLAATGPSPAATVSPNAAKSTLIIHASKKSSDRQRRQSTEDDSNNADNYANNPDNYVNIEDNCPDGEEDDYVVNTLQYPFPSATPTKPNTAASSTGQPNTPPGGETGTAYSLSPEETAPLHTSVPDDSATDDSGERGRGKKKTSFLGSIKRRFSRSRRRAQSVEPSPHTARASSPPDAPRTATVGRSVSVERSRRAPAGLLSVPHKSSGRSDAGTGDSGSGRSSLSDTSGLSGSSTRTYVNEASMLIIEAKENGVVKHYLVPVSLQRRHRWRKSGTKLHVFSGHTFVAKHISSGESCAACSAPFSRRPGKQGYECRDCGQRTHKPCHVATTQPCTASTVNTMDLDYLSDPLEERRAKRSQRQ